MTMTGDIFTMRLILLASALVLSSCGKSETWETRFEDACVNGIKAELVAPSTMKVVEKEVFSGLGKFDACFGAAADSGDFGQWANRSLCVFFELRVAGDKEGLPRAYMANVEFDSANRFNTPIRQSFSCYYIHEDGDNHPLEFDDIFIEAN